MNQIKTYEKKNLYLKALNQLRKKEYYCLNMSMGLIQELKQEGFLE